MYPSISSRPHSYQTSNTSTSPICKARMQSPNPESTNGFSVSSPSTRVIDYCPHDTPWREITKAESLRTQCVRRGLLDEGDVSELQKRLEEYQEAHRHENEPRGACWRVTPDEAWILANATRTSCQLIQVKDTSYVDEGWRWLEKQFMLYTRELGGGIFTVFISRNLHCGCTAKTIDLNGKRSCEHVLYVLRNILRCPEPLLYQNAFIQAELDYIFAANPFFYYFPNKTPERVPQVHVVPSPACVICFQEVGSTPLQECSKCGHMAHRECLDIFNNVRKPSQPNVCVLCEDEKEWACHEPEVSLLSQDMVDEEDGNKPLHEIKLKAMLEYEIKSSRHT